MARVNRKPGRLGYSTSERSGNYVADDGDYHHYIDEKITRSLKNPNQDSFVPYPDGEELQNMVDEKYGPLFGQGKK